MGAHSCTEWSEADLAEIDDAEVEQLLERIFAPFEKVERLFECCRNVQRFLEIHEGLTRAMTLRTRRAFVAKLKRRSNVPERTERRRSPRTTQRAGSRTGVGDDDGSGEPASQRRAQLVARLRRNAETLDALYDRRDRAGDLRGARDAAVLASETRIAARWLADPSTIRRDLERAA